MGSVYDAGRRYLSTGPDMSSFEWWGFRAGIQVLVTILSSAGYHPRPCAVTMQHTKTDTKGIKKKDLGRSLIGLYPSLRDAKHLAPTRLRR